MVQVVFLKNRGVLVGGESIEEAFHLLRRVMNAIDTQVCSDVLFECSACLSSGTFFCQLPKFKHNLLWHMCS